MLAYICEMFVAVNVNECHCEMLLMVWHKQYYKNIIIFLASYMEQSFKINGCTSYVSWPCFIFICSLYIDFFFSWQKDLKAFLKNSRLWIYLDNLSFNFPCNFHLLEVFHLTILKFKNVIALCHYKSTSQSHMARSENCLLVWDYFLSFCNSFQCK